MTPAQRRRKNAEVLATVYREDTAGVEHEIEVSVDCEYEGADLSVGIPYGGYIVNGATRIDNGEEIKLTPHEIDEIAQGQEERATDNAHAAAEADWESRQDR